MSQIKEENKQRGFVTLDSIVRSAIMDLGAGMERYEQFKHWAIEGYRDFHFDMAQEVKTVQLSLTAWKAIELPIDYVDWARIGVVVNEMVDVFTNDQRISLYRPDANEDGVIDPVVSPTTTTDPQTLVPGPIVFWGLRSSSGEDPGQLYGLLAKDNGVGRYKINRERREIQFDPSVASDTLIYLEYISDGIDPCNQTVVTLYAAKLIKLYIHWQRHRFAKSSTGAQVKSAEQGYWNEHYKVQNRIQKITVDDVLEVVRDAYTLAKFL